MKFKLVTYFILSILPGICAAHGNEPNKTIEGSCSHETAEKYFFIKVKENVYAIDLRKAKKAGASGVISLRESKSDGTSINEKPHKINIFSIHDRAKYGCKTSPLELHGSQLKTLTSFYVNFLNSDGKEITIELMEIFYGKLNEEMKKNSLYDFDLKCKKLNQPIKEISKNLIACFSYKAGDVFSGYFYVPSKNYITPYGEKLEGACSPKIWKGSKCTVSYAEGNELRIKYSLDYYTNYPEDIISIENKIREYIFILPQKEVDHESNKL